MKKLKIMFVAGLATLALCFGFFLPVGYVSADEVSQTPEISAEIGVETPDENPPVLDEETQDGTPIIDKDMDKFLQPILCGAAGLVGTLIVVAIVLFFLKKYGKEVKEFLKWLRERKVSFENEEKTLKTIDGHILSTYNKLEELREKNGTEYAEVLKLVKDLISTVVKENADTHHITDEHYHKIMKILEMLAVGNSELVRKGVADNIVKEIETADKV